MEKSMLEDLTVLFTAAGLDERNFPNYLPPQRFAVQGSTSLVLWRIPLQGMAPARNIVNDPMAQSMTLFHASTPEGTLGILRRRKLKAGGSELSSSGSVRHGVYGKGFLHDTDREWQKTVYHG